MFFLRRFPDLLQCNCGCNNGCGCNSCSNSNGFYVPSFSVRTYGAIGATGPTGATELTTNGKQHQI